MNNYQINQENNNEIEVWKPIEGYEGLYEVSSLGQIKRFYKGDFYTKGSYSKILKPCLDKKGYARISLYNSNHIRKDYKIHRLVALTFIPNPNNLPQVNHKNNIKNQNNVENLEWITNLNNMRHAWKNGFKNNNHLNGEKSHFTKISEELVRKIKKDYIPYKFGPRRLSQKYKIKEGCICPIIYGETWKHVII